MINHAQAYFQSFVFFITRSSIDHIILIPTSPYHIKTLTDHTTTDGLEVFSPLLPQSKDMMLIPIKLETNSVKIIGEKMPSLLSSLMVITSVKWITDLLKPGDSGTGKFPNAEDGHSGDTSIPTTMEESGLGLIVNQDQTAEPFEDFYCKPVWHLLMIYRIYLFNFCKSFLFKIKRFLLRIKNMTLLTKLILIDNLNFFLNIYSINSCIFKQTCKEIPT
mgnify:CR=1 FL=1